MSASINDVRDGLQELVDTMMESDARSDKGMGGRAGLLTGMLMSALLSVNHVMDILEEGIAKEEGENN